MTHTGLKPSGSFTASGPNATLEARAANAAEFLKLLANERRLMVLCALAEHGDMSVGPLAERVGLSQSALSQHLARMRAEGLVAYRRDGLTIYYRIADERAKKMLAHLHDVFCAD
ncbi:MAG: winged helix-turn-helix transcriptional regulator [Rhodobiaceae bacterium]|nr:winged helix-turn-helix transcriptional regulator [Rhodobiaceae bacterium]MCC0013382.1 winged helix-turn-helix transcriptional regulator [Rhodobiaceae bacterium]MCC0018986.1 winged helix-turn-helix transcriptional regulator [Rhodobiaceae bacterium]MCC0061504.1 winged helix-turn-helix transcriptional regulator [Rhodobiaceae bacterium]